MFADYAIAKHPSFKEHLNKYDVIYLDMTWFISNVSDIQDTVTNLQNKVVEELQITYPEVRRENTLPETLAAINKIIIWM